MFGKAFSGEKKVTRERRRSSLKREGKSPESSQADEYLPPIIRPPQRIDSRATAETLSSRDLLDESHTRTPETAKLSLSNDRVIEETAAVMEALDDRNFRTPTGGVSEVVAVPHMIRGLNYLPQEADLTRFYDHASDSNEDVSAPASSEVAQVHSTPVSEASSCATDATLAHSLATEFVVPEVTGVTMPRRRSAATRREASCLVTFQRRIEKHLIETTLHARADGEAEETMADLVRRLQRSAGVLTFGKKELKKIGKGSRQIVFILPQIQRATFSKEEFGQLTTSELMNLTSERPVLVEVALERTVSGEQLEIF